MEILFSPAKDASNIRKHGISLQEAVDFDMTTALIEVDNREDYGEVRYNAVGFITPNLCALTFTLQGSLVRAISLR